MSDRLDDLLGEMASRMGLDAPKGIEAAVWRRVDAREAGRSQLRSGVVLQCAIGACALLMGFSYQAYEHGTGVAGPRDPEPSLTLLDGSTVAEAGTFQVLR
ncbi:hypothetical protein [Caulobacter sp. S45]|uniref:hypothetical protein n=1 Tax=Caulobacter sp. S45 TaxID=1641861 RepID=UPI0015759BD9|nr:hypothetical protein [Caulobacter sp. S45]